MNTCESNGHIWGHDAKCVFCKDAQPAGPAEGVTPKESASSWLQRMRKDAGIGGWVQDIQSYAPTALIHVLNAYAEYLRAGTEQRADEKIRDYVLGITGVPIDANTDPVGFLIASHAALRAGAEQRGREELLKSALELLEPASEWMSQDELDWWVKYQNLRAALRSG